MQRAAPAKNDMGESASGWYLGDTGVIQSAANVDNAVVATQEFVLTLPRTGVLRNLFIRRDAGTAATYSYVVSERKLANPLLAANLIYAITVNTGIAVAAVTNLRNLEIYYNNQEYPDGNMNNELYLYIIPNAGADNQFTYRALVEART